jgi:hypothetical protein
VEHKEKVKMTTTAIEHTEAEIAHRKACAYLKGYIVGSSIAHGMKWDGDPERTPEFKAGFENTSGRGSDEVLTLAHILYNRLRHNKPHRTSGKRHYDEGYTDFDQAHIDWARREWPSTVNRIISELANYGIDAVSLVEVK